MRRDPFAPSAWPELEDHIERILSQHGFILVDCQIRQGRFTLVRVTIDHPRGVDIGKCTWVTRMLQAQVPWDALGIENCRLEVTSPGVGRELQTVRELRWATGRRVRVTVRSEVGYPVDHTGILKTFSRWGLRIEADATSVDIPWDRVIRVRLAGAEGKP